MEKQTRTDLYENLEVALNAGHVELLDIAKLRRELLTIVQKGASLDHMPGNHDDWATSAAGALTLVNPDIGSTTPAILTFMKRQVEAADLGQVPPTLRQEHGGAAVLQIGSRRPADFVMVRVPTDTSVIMGISGAAYATELIDHDRICWMAKDDAKVLIGSPYNLPFLEANRELRERLGTKPPQPRGIRVVDMLQAADDARQRSPFDHGGHAIDALRAVGRWPR